MLVGQVTKVVVVMVVMSKVDDDDDDGEIILVYRVAIEFQATITKLVGSTTKIGNETWCIH
jgi:hypothetical protein